MQDPNRGSGLVAGIVILAVLVLGGLYMFSDVFRTKVQGTARSMSEWTPENIAANPVGYLDFCETQTKATQAKLEANRISIAQRKSQLMAMQEDHGSTVATGSKALDAMKTAYKAAEAAGTWPMTYGAKTYDQDAAKKQIMGLHREIQSRTALTTKVEAGLRKLELQEARLIDAKTKCEEQLTAIRVNREAVKVKDITEDITDQLVEMKGVLAATTAIVDENDSGPMSLDEIAEAAETTVDEDAFAEIMK